MDYWPRDVSVKQTAGLSSVLLGRNPEYKIHFWLDRDASRRGKGKLLWFCGGGGADLSSPLESHNFCASVGTQFCSLV